MRARGITNYLPDVRAGKGVLWEEWNWGPDPTRELREFIAGCVTVDVADGWVEERFEEARGWAQERGVDKVNWLTYMKSWLLDLAKMESPSRGETRADRQRAAQLRQLTAMFPPDVNRSRPSTGRSGLRVVGS